MVRGQQALSRFLCNVDKGLTDNRIGDDPFFWTPAILNRRGYPSWPRLERRMPLPSGSK
ncbi:hypothetical protein CBM2598_U50011 [Cupriavidus taiwanensis]|uniref:Uncharacterized protein n=1 Tax=Cupriavidus taiwanensis TaxID=164546 RepID=A0A7Z7JIN0_9BURK|nr:hypothetical protein CBM2597_U50010 [Cupriavidus taiwanensis]SOZ97255.1 hypothetical protein CBM2598_U50011 [Cupriavidus taiwanensis]SPC26144.1 hypothetical protein CBM2594_U60010 [Cupriavidus taiwanensis]